MRRDMKKVLVGRPRSRGWNKGRWVCRRAKFVRLDEDFEAVDDFSRRTIPMKGVKHDFVWQKRLTDHVQPLRRYLDKQVGRSWNEVWKDICAAADARSTLGWHLRLHVLMAVQTDTSIDQSGRIMNMGFPLTPWELPQLYVDPTSGLLLCLPARAAS